MMVRVVNGSLTHSVEGQETWVRISAPSPVVRTLNLRIGCDLIMMYTVLAVAWIGSRFTQGILISAAPKFPRWWLSENVLFLPECSRSSETS